MAQKYAAKFRSKNGFSRNEIPLRRTGQTEYVVSKRKAISKRGFTLVEVVIAFVIFTILAAGLFSSAMQVRKWGEASVRESISTAVATGFLEQLTATDFANIIDRIEDRSQPFGFVSRDGEPLTAAQSLRPMSASDWGDPIEVPLINRVDKDGNEVGGPSMKFWFIPSVERSADTPDNSVDIRIRYRWDSGQGRDESALPVRSLFLVRTRVPN